MSLFVNAAPFEENSNTIENKKKQRNHTLKKPQKVKLPTITFNDDDSASLADFKPLAPPKMMKEPHMGNNMNQDGNMNNNFVHEGFDNEETSTVSEYPQKYSEKPMSRLEQHRHFVSNIKNNIHPINSGLEMNDVPINTHDKMTEGQKEINEKISYMIKLLEDQKHEKTEGVFEDVILYSFLGIFMIFLVESFTKAGKYVR